MDKPFDPRASQLLPDSELPAGMITVRTFCQRVEISESTARDWWKKGALPQPTKHRYKHKSFNLLPADHVRRARAISALLSGRGRGSLRVEEAAGAVDQIWEPPEDRGDPAAPLAEILRNTHTKPADPSGLADP